MQFPATGLILLSLAAAAGLPAAQAVPDVAPARQPASPAQPVELPAGVELRLAPAAEFALPAPKPTEFPQPSVRGERIGFHRSVPAQALAGGAWETVAGGLQIWRATLVSPGARSLRLHFYNFDAGRGKVFLSAPGDAAGTSVVGPYTGRGPAGSGEFWSHVVFGEKVVIEYQPERPTVSPGRPPFQIDRLSHVYRFSAPAAAGLPAPASLARSWLEPPAASDALSPVKEAAACHPDAACFSEYQSSKAATMLIQYEDAEGSGLCSGAFVNTRGSTGKPYFLTAGHCIADNLAAMSVVGFWGYWTSSCNAAAPPVPGPQVLGATLLEARPVAAPFAFLRMSNVPGGALRLGWTVNDGLSSAQIASVHYPEADYARVALARTIGFDDSDLNWTYTSGFTQPGSSGAPWMRDPGVMVAVHDNSNSSGYPDPCQALAGGLLIGGGTRFSAIYPAIQGYLEDNGSCSFSLSAPSATVAAPGGTGSFQVQTGAACNWTASSSNPWLTVTGAGTGSGTVSYTVQANPASLARTATITVAVAGVPQSFVLTQAGGAAGCTSPITVGATVNGSFSAGSCLSNYLTASYAARYTFQGTAGQQVAILLTSPTLDTYLYLIAPAGYIAAQDDDSAGNLNSRIPASGYYTLPATGVYSIEATALNPLTAGAYTLQLSGPAPPAAAGPFGFVPVTPCRLLDTRAGQGTTGAFGPPALASGSTREVPVPTGRCAIPSSAKAYSLNVTVVPPGPLGYLTMWPAGQPQPTVSTLNAFDGQITANAAIVPAGTNGSVNVFVSNQSDVIIDINGYFTTPGLPDTLLFFPVTPCRLADTRPSSGLAAGATRDFAVPQSSCAIPATARAYSLNATVVPSGPLGYLTLWPSGSTRPTVSTLNAFDGAVTANAAIVPAGAGGSISAFASNATHLVLDINGYFAPSGQGIFFYAANPCRMVDTRAGQGTSGAFGPPSLAGGASRQLPLPSSSCNIPPAAAAYSLNATVVPPAPLAYLTLWPWGQTMPVVSTLNSFDGQVTANAAIVPAGAGGAVGAFVTNPTDLILDINGYFAP